MSDLCSNIPDWITAVSGLGTLGAAIWVGVTAYKITKYQAKQVDREVIEKIYEAYFVARMEPMKEESQYAWGRAWTGMRAAYYMADIYGLADLAEKIKNQADMLEKIYALERQKSISTAESDELGELIKSLFKTEITSAFKPYLKLENRIIK